MAAYDTGSRKQHRDSIALWWGLGGLIIGLCIGLAGPRMWNRLRRAPQKPAVQAVAKPRPKAVETLLIAAQPAQRGLLLTSAVPVKMLKTSESGRAKQQDRAVFTGFKNWGVTMNYLTAGQGDLMIKAPDGTTTKWKQADYKALVQKKPLSAQIAPGKAYTLHFQRKGRRTVNLGTFSIGENGAPADEEADNLDAPDETMKADDPDASGELHDTSELDVEDAPVEDAPAEDLPAEEVPAEEQDNR